MRTSLSFRSYYRTKNLLVACFLLSVLPAWAECEPFRLDDPGEVFHNYPFLDQGLTGTCYAFTAAKLYDAFRMRQGGDPGKFSSPLESALNACVHNPHCKFRNMTGGTTCQVVDILMASGSCESNAASRTLNRRGDYSTYFNRISKIHDNYKHSETLKESNQIKKQAQLVEQACKYLSHQMHDASLVPSWTEIVAAMESEWRMEAVKALTTDQACQGESLIQAPTEKVKCGKKTVDHVRGKSPVEIQADLRELIHHELREKIPVGVAICAEALRGRFHGLRWGDNSSTKNVTGSDDCTGHGVAIIGRRMKADRCQFLIFNSYEVVPGDQGKVWVDAINLSENILEYQTVR